ncbi:Fic family protein [Candidatus Chromulinivorax destructor]|uniref:Fido domain-containing protein n=1 Tax=Candidatus Chromulinivorax destructor TaxID=2066483 RepID=A0A345ZA86_9BACT|nr:Fic/DOC family N-terminal domain-containing protein [Candidatus Chromulinivorax destructor]AXK60203.1 hypothetical protein C0J27_00360 [Candidatus Chromulinivorax destructor]
MRETGQYNILGDIHFFTPYDLPPRNPSFQLTPEILEFYSQAMYNLGSLNETSKRLPDQKRFIKAYIIKEALLSSAIEGIHTTLVDVLTHTQDESAKATKNTQLVINYIQALDVAIEMMQHQKLPICSRMILAAHSALLSDIDGNKATPGVYRKQTVKVGNLVPPMATIIPELMSTLEKYIHEDQSLPPLIQAGLVHLQFETIHPFLDGNGRIGRLLIILMLMNNKLLDDPILYISYYFKKHHAQYYQALDRVRTHGDFEGWISYYLQAVAQSALDANIRIKAIESLERQLQELIKLDPQLSKVQDLSYAVLSSFFATPISTIARLNKIINKSYNTTQRILTKFVELGMITQSSHKRDKEYRFDQYLDLLEKEY